MPWIVSSRSSLQTIFFMWPFVNKIQNKFFKKSINNLFYLKKLHRSIWSKSEWLKYSETRISYVEIFLQWIYGAIATSQLLSDSDRIRLSSGQVQRKAASLLFRKFWNAVLEKTFGCKQWWIQAFSDGLNLFGQLCHKLPLFPSLSNCKHVPN